MLQRQNNTTGRKKKKGRKEYDIDDRRHPRRNSSSISRAKEKSERGGGEEREEMGSWCCSQQPPPPPLLLHQSLGSLTLFFSLSLFPSSCLLLSLLALCQNQKQQHLLLLIPPPSFLVAVLLLLLLFLFITISLRFVLYFLLWHSFPVLHSWSLLFSPVLSTQPPLAIFSWKNRIKIKTSSWLTRAFFHHSRWNSYDSLSQFFSFYAPLHPFYLRQWFRRYWTFNSLPPFFIHRNFSFHLLSHASSTENKKKINPIL